MDREIYLEGDTYYVRDGLTNDVHELRIDGYNLLSRYDCNDQWLINPNEPDAVILMYKNVAVHMEYFER